MLKSHIYRCVSAAAITLLASPGCGSGPPPPADPTAARAALERALAAWQEGKTAESLKSDRSPIVVSDRSWAQGERLLKYQIEPGDHQAGADHVFPVILWLDDQTAKSKTKEKRVSTEYNVGTNPILTVVRGF